MPWQRTAARQLMTQAELWYGRDEGMIPDSLDLMAGPVRVHVADPRRHTKLAVLSGPPVMCRRAGAECDDDDFDMSFAPRKVVEFRNECVIDIPEGSLAVVLIYGQRHPNHAGGAADGIVGGKLHSKI